MPAFVHDSRHDTAELEERMVKAQKRLAYAKHYGAGPLKLAPLEAAVEDATMRFKRRVESNHP